MKVHELITHLSRVNPEAEVLMAPTDREQDLLPITGIKMKVPEGGPSNGKGESQAAVQVALRTHPAAPGSAVQQIEKMQSELSALMASVDKILKKSTEGHDEPAFGPVDLPAKPETRGE